MSDRLFFGLDGIDWHDEDAVRAATEKVWLMCMQQWDSHRATSDPAGNSAVDDADTGSMDNNTKGGST